MPTVPTTTLTIEDVTVSGDDPFSALTGLLRSYNDAHIGPSPWVPLYLFARDATGKVQAGLRGNTGWQWCYVEVLAVAEPYRKHGIGSRLLAEAERVARERGCIGMYLWSTSFQAPEFYKRKGFTEFGRIDDYPPGHTAHWLLKRF